MLKKVSIKNFKSHEKFEMDNLSQITLIGGKNNVGKTNLLEAIFLLYDRYNVNLLFRQNKFYGDTTILQIAEKMCMPVFNNFDLHKDIEISVDTEIGTETLVIKYNPLLKKSSFSATMNNETREVIKIRNGKEVSQLFALETNYKNENTEEKGYMVFEDRQICFMCPNSQSKVNSSQTIFLPSTKDTRWVEDAERFSKQEIEGNKALIIDCLKIIDSRVKDIVTVTVGNSSMIYVDVGMAKKIPASFMGSTFQKWLTIFIAIINLKRGIIFVDDIEQGLHHSIMKNLWAIVSKLLSKYNCQLIATTQSYDCLQAVVKATNEYRDVDLSYMRLVKINEEIKLKKFDYRVLKTAIKKEWEVR